MTDRHSSALRGCIVEEELQFSVAELQRDLGVNVEGAALALQLMDEIRRLRALLK